MSCGMRGLEEQHELSPQLLLRDTRTLGMKIVDFFKDPTNSAITDGYVCMPRSFMFPAFVNSLLSLACAFFSMLIPAKASCHFVCRNVPKRHDYNDPLPGSTNHAKRAVLVFLVIANQTMKNFGLTMMICVPMF